ncbi:MAG: hypothetical protein E7621_03675 [Ruminococcaceae bacterium]|nr:hypothetical protein [Oscillospiraceae bacterium]
MNKYKIAGLIVEMQPNFELLKSRSENYLTDSEKEPDITIQVSDEMIGLLKKQNPHLTIDECEYLLFGLDFYQKLPDFDAILLHSSCVAVDGYAYLFSAPCGTGKSTHTSLWKKHFGDRLTFINDDKPALRIIDGKVYACGTPFSGKTDLNSDVCVPVKGICILSRDTKNHIHKMEAAQALPKILNQTFRPRNKEQMIKVLELLDKIFANVNVYSLYCNMEDDAVITSYNGMNDVN